MNDPHDPNVTADMPSVLADALHAADALGSTDHVRCPASADRSQPGADEQACDLPTVPGYRVLRQIASGGTGRVLAAHDLVPDRDVALKVLLSGANSPPPKAENDKK
jgi:serine/threonine protein kinase